MLAVLVFIAGAAGLAALLFRTPTIADGRVIEADLLEELKKNGVASMACDRHIPIGIDGAKFRCVATLRDGATQTADFVMSRAGNYQWTLVEQAGTPRPSAPVAPRIPPSGDPWAN
jgi:L-2-hydroxyglutarate oxidase LhgO